MSDINTRSYLPITVSSDWSYCDELDDGFIKERERTPFQPDDKIIEEGELLEILWPNGEESIHEVHLECSGFDPMDDALPVQHAYIYIEHNGCKGKLFLRKEGVLVRRLEEQSDE